MNAARMVDLAPHTRARGPAPVEVLVAHAFYMAQDPKQLAKSRPYPPLSSLILAAMVHRGGRGVAFFDAMLAPDERAFEAALAASGARLLLLQEDNFNFLTKMCLDRMRQAALTMIRMARAHGLAVMVNGSDASDHPAVYLAAGALAVARGEGERTLLEAALLLLAPSEDASKPADPSSRLAAVAGLVTQGADGRLRFGPERLPESRPDAFPEPDRELVDMEAYRAAWRARHGRFSLNIAASRGCPFHCNWCAKPIWGQRYSLRSPEAVAREIRSMVEAYAPDQLWFADDIFGLRPEWTAAFGRAMAAAGLRLPFQAQSRVDLITDDAAAGLSLAGCEELWLGVESGDQGVLDAMEKGLDLADLPAALDRLRRRGIRVGFFLQFGYPGEDWAALMRTVELVRRHVPDAIGISVSYPLPGTRFHERVRAELGPRDHWQDSQDLAMLYRGPFPSEVYRRLHTLLHAEHEALLARRDAPDAAAAAAAEDRLTALRPSWEALELDARRRESHGPSALEIPLLSADGAG